MTIWDRGTYETEKWTDREVKVVLHGDAGRRPVRAVQDRREELDDAPDGPAAPTASSRCRSWSGPMLATLRDDAARRTTTQWAYEMKWDGVRAVVYVDGGRPRALSRNDIDITRTYPELRAMAASLGSRPGRARRRARGARRARAAQLRAAAAADARHGRRRRSGGSPRRCR